MSTRAPELRSIARQAIKEKVTEAALTRFRENGFADTTLEDISGDVGMSTRTFFRYFHSKDDILLDGVREFSRRFLDAWARSSMEHGVWEALYDALAFALVDCRPATLNQREMDVQDLIRDTPALLAKQLEILEGIQSKVADTYRARVQEHALSPRTIHATAGAAFACLHAAQLDLEPGSDVQTVLGNLKILMAELRPEGVGSR